MLLKIIAPALMLAIPSVAAAHAPSGPRSAVIGIANQAAIDSVGVRKHRFVGKCHHESSKAVACEAQARLQHARDLAALRTDAQLSQR